ncbi:hypothetical protein K8I61_11035, partial [bacterium]|nr:hypothetical protein [bacterium]
MSRVSGDLDQASLLRMFMSKWQGSDVSPNAATFEIAMREAASQNETHESERRLREDMIPSTGDGRIGSDNPAPDVNEDVVSTGVAKHTPRADNGEGRIGSENSGPAPQAPQTASPQTPADKANAPAAPKIQAPAALQKGALKISFVSTASASDAPAVAPKATMPVVSSKVPAPLAPKAAPAIATPAAAEHAALRPAPLAKAHAAATIVAANPEAVTKPANASRDTRFRWPMNIESLETFAPVEDAPVTAPKPAVSRDEAAAIARVVRDLMNNRPIEARPAAAASVETPDDTTEPAAETRQ